LEPVNDPDQPNPVNRLRIGSKVSMLKVCDLKSFEGIEKIIFEVGKLRGGNQNINESRLADH
jgi:hypothetical protein